MLTWKKVNTRSAQLVSTDGRFHIEGHWDAKPGYYELVDTKTGARERSTKQKALKERAFEIITEEAGPPWRAFRAYVDNLKNTWVVQHRIDSRDVYELMAPLERERVDVMIAQWSRYITPLAEAWWQERGYRVVWPDDNSQPMEVFKLETA